MKTEEEIYSNLCYEADGELVGHDRYAFDLLSKRVIELAAPQAIDGKVSSKKLFKQAWKDDEVQKQYTNFKETTFLPSIVAWFIFRKILWWVVKYIVKKWM